MSRKMLVLGLVFALIASFGLNALLINPTVEAGTTVEEDKEEEVIGCAIINAWAASVTPSGSIATVKNLYAPIEADLLLIATGTNMSFEMHYGSDSTVLATNASRVTYVTKGTETALGMQAANVESLTCVPYEEGVSYDDGRLFYDDRLNANTPNAPVVFFPTDGGIQIYPNNGTGIILDVNAAFLSGKQDIPGENTLYWQSEDGKMSFWKLSTGEYQFMVGPDASGNYYVTVFDAMPPSKITNRSFNIYGGSTPW